MPMAFAGIWTTLDVAFNLTAAIALASLAIWLWPRRGRLAGAGGSMLVALVVTAGWCLAVATATVSESGQVLSSITETARNLCWLLVVYRLFASDGRHAATGPIRPVIYVLAFVELLHFGIDCGLTRVELHRDLSRVVFEFNVMFRLLVTIGGLVLVHNLYAGAPREMRPVLRWPAAGLAVFWSFDLNLYTVAYLAARWPLEMAAFRGLATLALTACLALGASAKREVLRLRPSRAVTFQTFSLLVIGSYLVAMVAIAQWLSYAKGDFARLFELTFLTLASAVALVVLPSRRVRAWLQVMLVKHFFQHRYDYREEWLRFTRTVGNGGEAAPPLAERVVQSVADVFESPCGLLIAPGEQGDLVLAARWNWTDIAVPAVALPMRLRATFERSGYILDLDELRKGLVPPALDMAVPDWLLHDPRAWALIPLVHNERLVGLVVLARPRMARRFDWEDFDLLRVMGPQAASYLAEHASQAALAESHRFEDFHRRIAFVMHDIKNLASQFSLLARNAQLHADKPEFRADMLVTLRNSSEKLNALIARLSRYGNGVVERLEEVRGADVIGAVMERFRDHPRVVLSDLARVAMIANRHSLEQVLMHLVQNALDASSTDSPVFLSLAVEGGDARLEVLDGGCGMSADFVRQRLFRPFDSTKNGGFGIGAFEARELVRAMRGRLDVESREGVGSRFIIRVPLAGAAGRCPSLTPEDQKVA